MHIREIPHLIFEELVVGEPESVNVREAIAEDNPALSERDIAEWHEEGQRLVGETLKGIWLGLEEPNKDATRLHIASSRLVASCDNSAYLDAGQTRTGVWIASRGDRYQESLRLHMPQRRVSGENLGEYARLLEAVGQIAALGAELLSDDRFEISKEIYPNS